MATSTLSSYITDVQRLLHDANGNFYIDVFSCKPFDNDTVIQTVDKYFKPEKVRMHYISRDA